MLVEKPSHNTASEAKEFAKILKAENLENRLLIGLHDGLHPSRKALLECIKQYQDLIVSIDCFFNYPKDPQDDWRTYHEVFGGTMLDLGIYSFKLTKDIGDIMGFNLKEFRVDDKRIRIKRAPTGVDTEVQAWLNYDLKDRVLPVYLETMISPGSDFAEELKIKLANGD